MKPNFSRLAKGIRIELGEGGVLPVSTIDVKYIWY